MEAHDPFTVSEAYDLKEIITEERPHDGEPSFRLVNTGTIDPYLNFWGAAEIVFQDEAIETRHSKVCTPQEVPAAIPASING